MTDWNSFSGCCNWGFERVEAQGPPQWFVQQLNPPTHSLWVHSQKDGATILGPLSNYHNLAATEDLGNLYTFTYPSEVPVRIYKWDANLNAVWNYSDTVTEVFPFGLLGPPTQFTTVHFDVDSDYNFYYCGKDPATEEATLTKLNSSGSQVWQVQFLESMGGTVDEYRFVSCAVDLDKNVCAVGGRTKYTGTAPFDSSNVAKSDYIVIYFDSSGNEVWRDVVADDATLNANNKRVWAYQVCFDADGNVYVGFTYIDNTGAASRPVLRKYDSSGTIIWTKTATDTFHHTFNVIATPAGKLIFQYRKSSVGGSFIQQLSGSTHSTVDWTRNLTSSTTTSDNDSAIHADGDVFAVTEAGIHRISTVNAAFIFNLSKSGLRGWCLVKPGRHPNFI